MKAKTVDYQTWTATITVELNKNDFHNMREWLDQHAPPVPSRNSDVLGKFIAVTLNSNAQYDGVYCRFVSNRPTVQDPPPQDGCHDDPLGDRDDLVRHPNPWVRFAIDTSGFALLLAAFVTVDARMCTSSPHPTRFCSTLQHALEWPRSLIQSGRGV